MRTADDQINLWTALMQEVLTGSQFVSRKCVSQGFPCFLFSQTQAKTNVFNRNILVVVYLELRIG